MVNAWVLTETGPETYEKYQVPAVFGPLAEMLIGRTGLRPGDCVLDVACGTGIVARRAAEIVGSGGRVVGVDFNPGMLEIAKKNTPAEFTNIEWHHSDASDLPVEDNSVDFAFCQQGLQFFPDRPAALAEMHRTLRSGGRLCLAVWQSIEHSPVNLATRAALEHYVGSEIAKMTEGVFALGDSDALRSLMEGAGFKDIDIEALTLTRHMAPPNESIPAQLTSLPIGPKIAALDKTTRNKIVEEITEALSEYSTDEGMSVPQGTHIATAQKL